jgi:mRNA interferase RelE/StbE
MKRRLVYRPAAQRELERLDRSEAGRIIRALESFAVTGRGDIKALKGALKGRYRLRVGKWRIFFSFDQPGTIVVIDIDNRGQAY